MNREEHKNPDDYLELIYIISEEDSKGYARTKELSERLGVYPSTVTEMMQKLSERGLVIWISYGGVKLTNAGKEYAKSVLKRHRILECFFFQYLGLDPSDVQNEVCGIEHHLSGEILDRLYARLGKPKFCPHGKPIPTSER
ncbi:MAG: metal-dependent transcriptional regulator [Candidatus Methanomethylicaceae archaeon]